jgi:hypothetical protein
MGIEDAHVALALTSLILPSIAEARDGTLDLTLAKATVHQLKGRLVLTSALIAWKDVEPESGTNVAGYARSTSVQLDLDGDRAKPSGRMSLAVPSIHAAGRIDAGIGSDNPAAVVNCTVHVPANISVGMRGISGRVNFAAGKVTNGSISADEVDRFAFRFTGDKACNFMLTVSISYRFNVPCFPDFWNSCEAKDTKEFKIPARLIVYALNMDLELHDVNFDIESSDDLHPKLKWCHANLHKLYPQLPHPVLVTVEPDFSSIPWPFSTLADAAAKYVLIPFYALFETDLIAGISVLSIIGVGDLIPIRDKCEFHS